MDQLNELNIDTQVLGADGWDGILTAIDSKGLNDIEGVYFVNHYVNNLDNDNVRSFFANYKAIYNEEPSAFSALGYDTMFIIKEAMESSGETSVDVMLENLEDKIRDVELSGITGEIQFEGANTPAKSGVISKIENGKIKYITKVYGE